MTFDITDRWAFEAFRTPDARVWVLWIGYIRITW